MKMPQGVTFTVDAAAFQEVMLAATFDPSSLMMMREDMLNGTNMIGKPLSENPLYVITQQCNQQVAAYELNNCPCSQTV